MSFLRLDYRRHCGFYLGCVLSDYLLWGKPAAMSRVAYREASGKELRVHTNSHMSELGSGSSRHSEQQLDCNPWDSEQELPAEPLCCWSSEILWDNICLGFVYLFLILTWGYSLHQFFRKGGEETKTLMWKRHIDGLPPLCAQTGLGMEPSTQELALDQENQTQNLWCAGQHFNHWNKLARAICCFKLPSLG